jgi:hypothetical protein
MARWILVQVIEIMRLAAKLGTVLDNIGAINRTKREVTIMANTG